MGDSGRGNVNHVKIANTFNHDASSTSESGMSLLSLEC